jgi:hypothetical protein
MVLGGLLFLNFMWGVVFTACVVFLFLRNTKDRVCLNAHDKDWLKEVTKENPEAKWETQNIHNKPYQIASDLIW